LSDKNFFSAHVSKTENLSFIVNHVMMDNDGLPDKNTLEGLLVLRQAWDLADIGRYVLKRYKRLAKACYLIMILLAIAIAIVSIQKDMIDKSSLEDGEPKQMYGRKLSELLTFSLSVATSFAAAIMAFTNPVTRWQQIRDAVANMESAIWFFRTRTGAFKQMRVQIVVMRSQFQH